MRSAVYLVTTLVVLISRQPALSSKFPHKCCPLGSSVGYSVEGGQHVYCTSDRNPGTWLSAGSGSKPWHPDPLPGFPVYEMTTPGNSEGSIVKYLMKRCGGLELQRVFLGPQDRLSWDENQQPQVLTPGGLLHLGTDSCVDRILETDPHPQNPPPSGDTPFVLLTCSCLHNTCFHLCCGSRGPHQHSTEEEGRCGYPLAAWYAAISRLPDQSSGARFLPGAPTPKCLQATPSGGLEHRNLRRASSEFTITENNALSVAGQFPIPMGSYCMSLEDSINGPEISAYYCHNEDVTNILKAVWVEHPVDHRWLAGLAAALSTLTLAMVVLSPRVRSGLTGLVLIVHCVSTLLAAVSMAFLSIAVSTLFTNAPQDACSSIAHVIQYGLLVSFYAFQVCVLLAFAPIKSVSTGLGSLASFKIARWWRVLLLALYIFLIPAIHVFAALGTQALQSSKLLILIRPLVTSDCWFHDMKGLVGYYVAPETAPMIGTFIQIIIIVVRLRRATKEGETGGTLGNFTLAEEQRRQDRHSLAQGLCYTLILLLSYIGELLCVLTAPKHLFWLLMSLVIALRAAIVLLVFAVPPQIWSKLRRQCPCCVSQGTMPIPEKDHEMRDTPQPPMDHKKN